jgi:hypothetical protein
MELTLSSSSDFNIEKFGVLQMDRVIGVLSGSIGYEMRGKILE